ncbi:MAG: hypothetical protein V3V05_02505 [Pontiella sp.]
MIDRFMAFGLKYLARTDGVELLIRHVQIEPLLYRHMLRRKGQPAEKTSVKLNGIDGDFGVENLKTMVKNNLTVGHDLLSYEAVERFDRAIFLDNLEYIRSEIPEDHEQFSKGILEQNKKHSLQWLGPTNLVLLIVMGITVLGDLNTTVTALNSFGSDSMLLWCMKRIYAGDTEIECDLDFFMQETNNRGHYNSSAFFSNPSQYLYYHIVFDEVIYDMLRTRPAKPQSHT